MNSSYWQALFQAELGCVHGGRAGRREAVGKGKRLERIPDVVVNEVLAGAGCDAELTSATQKQKACSKAGFLNSGSSDWTRTSSVSPVVTDFVKFNYIFTNIFTIIIVFLSIKCQLKTIGCCHNHLTIRILFNFIYQHDVVVIFVKVIDIKQLVNF
ncbi:hypothetical protein IE978_29410 [Klebsiella pneumoniae]|uniref:Uncharacterized protein n=1 Tax=Klebsiella pneumoniae TaxID=573 RepID=A0A927HX17_KLEPN|nr:hypothetical protein [Klebsiella pneumoniae]